MTTDEWVAENALGLCAEISCHVKVLAEELSEEDKIALIRMIMISIRNWDEDTGV